MRRGGTCTNGNILIQTQRIRNIDAGSGRVYTWAWLLFINAVQIVSEVSVHTEELVPFDNTKSREELAKDGWLFERISPIAGEVYRHHVQKQLVRSRSVMSTAPVVPSPASFTRRTPARR
jgi:hypothetical protein